MNNCLFLEGNLAEDLYICGNADNTVVKLAVITNETFRDKATGEQRQTSVRHSVSVFGWKAKQIVDNAEYFRKGALVHVKAKMVTVKSHRYEGIYEYQPHVDNTTYTSVDAVVRFTKNTVNSSGSQRAQPVRQRPQPTQQYSPRSESLPQSNGQQMPAPQFEEYEEF
ncbi:single-stranded DNA-binding protein [Vibrio sp. Y2-5]|uniref:single-stranded DNA-binding protein n=1 Tax=Vibrio sp. Y2-5 TaxID=2743977 RepID=UPI001660B6B7|nr:single-stranded DNA-binding protein [Vibrio sp. Y2-5]MBD0788022.1 single-stranded DNA-binding protein [Vibrio sp. Y2-5]